MIFSFNKDFLITYKNETIEKEFKRITECKNSLKAFKYIYDFDMLDVLVPDRLMNIFHKEKTKFSNKIFNYILIGEFLMNDEFFQHATERKNKKIDTDFNKYEVYLAAINNSLNIKESLIESKRYQFENNENIPLATHMVKLSELYCIKQIDKCQEKILTYINLKELKRLIFALDLRYRIIDHLR